MAQYRVPDGEDYMECPYNNTHMIQVKRFPYHLMKCRHNYVGSDFVSCPFNAKHEMPRPELRYHLGTCPDRATIELDLAYAARREADGDIDRGCVDLPVYQNVHIPQSECWDDEVSSNPRVGIDPSHFSKFKFVNLTGLSTSEKKDLKKNWNVPIDQKMAEWSSKQQEQMAEEEQSLRRPASIPSNYSQAAANSNPAMLPTTVFNYSVGVGRGVRGQINESVNPDPPQEVKKGKGRSYGRGRGIQKPGLIQQQQVNGIHRSSLPPPPGIFGIGRGSSAMTDLDVNFSNSMGQPSFVVPTLKSGGGVRQPATVGMAGSMTSVTPPGGGAVRQPTTVGRAGSMASVTPPSGGGVRQPVTIGMAGSMASVTPPSGGGVRQPATIGMAGSMASVTPPNGGGVRHPTTVGMTGSMATFIPPNGGGVRQPTTVGMAGSMASFIPSNDWSSTVSPAEEYDQSISEGEAVEDAKNQKTKKIRKKLRQIEILEQRQREGYILTRDEERKLSKKEDLLAELAKLRW